MVNRSFNSNGTLLMSPCYQCKERTIEPRCHATCKKYAKFKEDYAVVSKRSKVSRKRYF